MPEENNPAIRELFVFYSYRMLYHVIEVLDEIHIVAFMHRARDLEKALDEES